MHRCGLTGQNVVVPGVRRRFQQLGESVLRIPERLIQQRGQRALWPLAHTAHIAIARLPHHLQNAGMAAEALRVAARRGQADHRAPEGVLDQLFWRRPVHIAARLCPRAA